MTIRHLKIFIAVYHTGNITRASEQLHMTQPGVTRAIQELERYYGVRLFERVNRKLLVSESGKQFYAQALHIVDSFDAMEKGMRNWDEFGVLRVGATITLGNVLMPVVVSEFQKMRPHLRVEVTVCNGAQLQRALLDNQLDLALIEGDVSNDQLKKVPFAQDQLVLVLSGQDPLCQKETLYLCDLKDCRFLLRENGSVGRSFLNHVFAVHGLPLVPLWESTSTHAILQAVGMGLGISFLPKLLVRDELASGRIVTRPIEDESFLRSNYIVWHKNKFLTNSSKEFMQLCRATAAGIASGELTS